MSRGSASEKRIGVFGGTFDPPHVGHLVLAEWALERFDLDQVLFVPAGRPPHKRRGAVSSAKSRLLMTRLAVRGNPLFRVSTSELRREGPSYTIRTIEELSRRRPRTHLYLILGADSLDDFRNWEDTEGILACATLAVAGRPGSGGRASVWARRHGRVVWIGNPKLEISSSQVRARARAGLSLRYLVPDAVAHYIQRRRLYGRR